MHLRTVVSVPKQSTREPSLQRESVDHTARVRFQGFPTAPPPAQKETPHPCKKEHPPLVLAPTPCLETGCPDKAVHYGRCQQHQRPAWYGSTRKQRLPKDWAARRLIVLRRDQGICYLCGQPGADTVDHVTPGDDHSLNNLKAVHDAVEPHCHRAKSSQEGHTASQGNRVKRRH